MLHLSPKLCEQTIKQLIIVIDYIDYNNKLISE